MEILFENNTTITKEILAEFSQKTFNVYARKYRAFTLIMHIISLLTAVFFLIVEGLSWIVLCFILFAGFFLFMFFKAYLIKQRENYKNLKGLHGGLPNVTIRFYEDALESITSRSNLKIEYSKITKVIETQNLILLMIEKQGVILLKTGFEIGDYNSFKVFIKEKCSRI